MTCDRPNNLSNMADYLPTAVKRAATQAGVEPVSSVDNLAAEASDAEELQNMLEAEVQRSLANRLASDDDYSADRWACLNFVPYLDFFCFTSKLEFVSCICVHHSLGHHCISDLPGFLPVSWHVYLS